MSRSAKGCSARAGLRSLGVLDFSIHEVSLTLERIGRQTHFASWIVTIESRPIDIHTVRVKLTQAGQQLCPIVTPRPQRRQPESSLPVRCSHGQVPGAPGWARSRGTLCNPRRPGSASKQRIEPSPECAGANRPVDLSVRPKPPGRSDWRPAAIAARSKDDLGCRLLERIQDRVHQR